jgi:hypothetical protein
MLYVGKVNAMLTSQNKNLSDRLIRIIEANAQELTDSTVKELQTSPRTESYHKLSYGELYSRAYEVHHNFGRWLWEKSNEAIQARYNELGKKRCDEGIPLSEVLWALVLTKDRLIDYLSARGLADSAIELYQQQELYRLINHFFDRAICYTAEGYDRRSEFRRSMAEAREIRRSRRFWRQEVLKRTAPH